LGVRAERGRKRVLDPYPPFRIVKLKSSENGR